MSIMRTHSKGPCALGILPLRAGLSLQILDSLSAFMRLERQHLSGQEPSERTSGSEAFLRSQRLEFHSLRTTRDLGTKQQTGAHPSLTRAPSLSQPPTFDLRSHLKQELSQQRHLKPALPSNPGKGLSPPLPGHCKTGAQRAKDKTTDQKAPARARLEASVT